MKYNKEEYKAKNSKGIIVPENKQRELYMWNVPKHLRKQYLSQKVSEKEMDRIYGKTKWDLLANRRRPQVTVPEPFNFNHPTGKKYRDYYLDDLLEEKRVEKEKVESFRFVANKIPKSTYGNYFRKLQEKEEAKRQYWDDLSKLNRKRETHTEA